MKLIFGNGLLSFGTSLLAFGTDSVVVGQQTFTTTLSPTSGQSSTMATYTVTPGSAGFLGGKTVQPVVSGFGSPSAQTTTAGSTTPLQFVLLVTGSAGSTATANVAIDGMTNQTGAQQFAISQASASMPPPTPTTAANHFDVALAKSMVPAGITVAGTIIPTNGLWSGGALPLIPSNGDPTINVTLPSSGNSPVAFTYTPTKEGEVQLNYGSVAGMYPGAPAPLNVFAASNGVARTITAHFADLDLLGTQRQCASGNPSGFNLYNWGWGVKRVVIDSIDGSTAAIWMRPHACTPNDPTPTAAGTGTQLHPPVQVYGTVSAAGTINIILPASIPFISWDIAGDSAMTNAYRLPQRARVGHVRFMIGRSIANTLADNYAYGYISDTSDSNYNTQGNAALITWPASNQNVSTFGTFNNDSTYIPNMFDGGSYSGGVARAFLQYDKTGVMPWNGNNGAHGSTGMQEIGRLYEGGLGVGVTVVFGLQNGQPTDRGIAHDGTLESSTLALIAAACPAGFREIETGWAANAGEWSDTTYPPTVGEQVTRYTGFADKIAKLVPGCGTILIGSFEGWYGSDGSRDNATGAMNGQPGYVRLHVAFQEQIAAINPMVVTFFNTNWNARYLGHPKMGCRIPMAGSRYIQYRQGEHVSWGGLQVPYANRGPTLSRSAQYISAQKLIRIFGKFNGSTGIKAIKLDYVGEGGYALDSAAPSAAELASTISVYPGYPARFDTSTAIPTTGAVINTTSLPAGFDFSIDVTLSGSPTGTEFTCQTAEFGNSNSALTPANNDGSAVLITDTDHIANGVPFGFEVQPQIDIHATVS